MSKGHPKDYYMDNMDLYFSETEQNNNTNC